MAHGHGHADHGGNKGIALLISVLALVLAFAETLGKSAQTTALNANIEAANLWAFYQAKTIRQTTLRAQSDAWNAQYPAPSAPMKKQLEAWKKTIERYESEEDPPEGRKQLVARVKEVEKKRDRSLAAYHHYEMGSAAVQIAIVLASASIIAGVVALAWAGAALGVVGVVFCVIGFFFPTAVHLF